MTKMKLSPHDSVAFVEALLNPLPPNAALRAAATRYSEAGECPLCRRSLGDINVDEHHLIPKTFKGTETVRIHKICHRKIHATFSERELLNYYHTIERLLEHEHIKSFVKWVSKKDPSFYDGSDESTSRRKKRRR